MEKMKLQSADIIAKNIEKLAEIFPSCVSEGKVNLEAFKQLFSDKVIDGEEAYNFNWVGKKAAMVEAHTPIRKTLRPCVEESVNWDTTENLYIEGDNLEVLKLLQENYLNAVKMIYIDPPYNTGNDFIYVDDFEATDEEYKKARGVYDEENNKLFKNTDTNGRFHSDWCSMIYSRLLLARNLLTDDGVIFISIDDNEQANLKSICDEVFGESNFISQFIWKSKLGKVGTTSLVSNTHEYIMCYAKNIYFTKFKMIETFTDGRRENLRQWGQADRRTDRPSMYYPISINDVEVYPIKDDGTEGRWRVGKNKALELLRNGELEYSNGNIYRIFPSGISISAYETFLTNVGTTADGSKALKLLGLERLFDYSKPPQLIKFLADIATDKNDIVLDFFSGSATTAQAVLQLNSEGGV